MNTSEIKDPFKYLDQHLKVNILRGISTSLIESDIFTILPLYWFESHWSNNNTVVKKSAINDSKEYFDRGAMIQFPEVAIDEHDLNLSNKQNDHSQEQNEELLLTQDHNLLEHQDERSLVSSKLYNYINSGNVPCKISEDGFGKMFEEECDDCSDLSSYSETLETPSDFKKTRKGPRTKHSNKLVRWGKKNDKILWNVLNDLKENSKETYEMITSAKPLDVEEHSKLLSTLSKKAKWKGTLAKFLKRVKKIILQNGFSFREGKKLRSFLRKGIRNKNIDIDAIAKEFPGKGRSSILSEIKKIKSQYKIMKNILITDVDDLRCLEII